MNTIYIIRPSFCFPLVPNTATRLIPDNYDEIASVVLSCSGKTNINAHPDLMYAVKTYFFFSAPSFVASILGASQQRCRKTKTDYVGR